MARVREIRWSRKAIQQVQMIGDHIEIDSPWQAERIVRKLHAAPETLREFPRKGTIVPEFGDSDLREISVHSWRVIYRLVENDVILEVAAVVHGKRLLKRPMLGSPQ